MLSTNYLNILVPSRFGVTQTSNYNGARRRAESKGLRKSHVFEHFREVPRS